MSEETTNTQEVTTQETVIEDPNATTSATDPVLASVTIPSIDQLKTMTKDDLLKLQQDAASFPAAIEQVIAAKIEEETAELKKDVHDTEEAVQTWSEKFREKHGVSVPVALVVGGYIVWQVGAAVARALGVL